MNYRIDEFISNSTTFSSSLTAVIITGTAILVSLTSSDFLLFLKKENIYRNLMFSFEYTTLLSIFTSLFGIILQSYNYSYIEIYAFLFIFLYLVFAASRLISIIVSFGDKRGDFALVMQLDNSIETSQLTANDQVDASEVSEEETKDEKI